MSAKATHMNQYTANQSHLCMAFELSQNKWLLGFTIGFGQRPRLRTIAARDLAALQSEIHLARERFALADNVQVISCYEAGRDGFWLHRYLSSLGVSNRVVDSASIEVNRRAKQAKTDKLDLGKLLTMLIRYEAGETKVWRVVHVPSSGEEDNRHLHRELTDLKEQRTQYINRIKGYLSNQGICLEVDEDFPERVAHQQMWNGESLPSGLRARLWCEYQRFQLVQEQIQTLEAERRETLQHSTQPEIEQVRRLRGIGINCAWLYVMEFFSWRAFRNRREVGALAGLTPMPHRSGEEDHELGISKIGNRHIRAMAIEIACRLAPSCSRHERWIWLRYQPNSELSLCGNHLSLLRSLPGWWELPVMPPGFVLEPPVRGGCSPSASPTLSSVYNIRCLVFFTSTDRRRFGHKVAPTLQEAASVQTHRSRTQDGGWMFRRFAHFQKDKTDFYIG